MQEKVAMQKSEEAAASNQKAMAAKTDAENELYQGIQSTLTVSADKMNVLYRGILNPVSISVSGIKSENLIVSVNNGIIKKITSGKYEVLPDAGLESTILVKGKTNKGDILDFGSKSYRVKNIPEPVAKINGKNHGKITKKQLINTPGIAVDLSDFPFDLKFTVIQYSVMQTVEVEGNKIYKQDDVNGNLFTTEVMAVLKSLSAGSTIVFTNIKAKGPDGKIRYLMPIVFQVAE